MELLSITNEQLEQFNEMKKLYSQVIQKMNKKKYNNTYWRDYYDKNKCDIQAKNLTKMNSKYATDEEYREKRRAYQREYIQRKKNQ